MHVWTMYIQCFFFPLSFVVSITHKQANTQSNLVKYKGNFKNHTF